MDKILTFEEAHGVFPDEERARELDEDGIGWRDQFNLCCCQCTRCKPNCVCNVDWTSLCMICVKEEATEQLSNETGYYVCYGCKIAQREVI